MTDLPLAQSLRRAGSWSGPARSCTLDYEGRFLRRRRLVADDGTAFLVDLPQATSLEEGDALVLQGGGAVRILAAAEPVLVITGPDLARLAWHIGNRHTPCQVGRDWLVIRRDKVIRAMLAQLGAEIAEARRPFRPEGGAYGHGRTHGHAHGDASGQGHGHGSGDGPGHAHEHDGGQKLDHGHLHEPGHGDRVARGPGHDERLGTAHGDDLGNGHAHVHGHRPGAGPGSAPGAEHDHARSQLADSAHRPAADLAAEPAAKPAGGAADQDPDQDPGRDHPPAPAPHAH